MGCAIFESSAGGKGFMCGSGITPCGVCGRPADFLCDYPSGKGKTCDLPLCWEHAHPVQKDRQDLCLLHY